MNLQQTKKISVSFILLLLLSVGAFAQVRSVTGQVTDIDGKPVAGVTVVVKGTAGNVITDANGRYKVMATPEQTIIFTHISFGIQEAKVGTRESVDVTLLKTDNQLDDVIVIGYGTQRQKNVTGSVVNVNLSKLSDQPVATVTEALRGQVPGLNVQGGSQRPGVMPSLSIRQQFNWGKDGGVTNPLIIIDDVIQVDPQNGLSTMDRFNLLDLSEVESITVLRDASAAIYGSRASQGAIIVKTKRGKIGAPKISYAGKFENMDAISHGKVMNAYEYGVFSNRFGRALGWNNNNFYSDAELERMKSLNYDWLDNDWKASNAMQHSMTVSGGSERATYFMGGSYYTQGANLGSQDFNRYTFRAGSEVTVTNGLKLSATLGANNSDLEKSFTKINVNDGSYGVGGEQMDYSTLLHMPKYIPWIYKVNGVDTYVSPALGPNRTGNISGNNSISNTNYYALLNNGSKTTTDNFGYNANFSLQYELPFVKGLSVKANYAIQSNSAKTEQAMMPVTLAQNRGAATLDRHLYDNADWSAPTVNKSSARVSYETTVGTTEQINFFVNYDRSFGDHNVSAVFSGERSKNNWEQQRLLYDQPTAGVYNGTSVTAGTINPDNSITYRQENGTLSYLGRVSYNYKSKYLFQFVFRQDASSRFAPENYWGFFPTVSAGWVISDENFFRDNVSWVNFLKLRASIGKTGNDNVKPWKWMQLYKIESSRGLGFGGTTTGGYFAPGVTPEVAPNRDVKWDRTIQRNFGLDFSVLQNRLTVNIDQYFNSYNDVLTEMTGAIGVPFTVGGGFAEQNYSSIRSWGTEISATWKDKIANKIDYSIGLNFGTGNNETTKYFDLPFKYPSEMETRKAVGNSGYPGVWGFKTWKNTSSGDGILRTDEDIDAYWAYLTDNAAKSGVAGAAPKYGEISNKASMKKGMVAYEDVRGALNTADRTYAGPNGIIGMGDDKGQDMVRLKKDSRTYAINTNLTASYKGISLSAQIVTSWGGWNQIDFIRNNTNSTAMLWAQPIIMNDIYDPVDNVNGKYPNLAYYSDFGGLDSDADFWKVSSFRAYVRTLSIGYTLPKNWVRMARLDNARLYLSGNNLWDFYNPYPNKYRNMYDAPNVIYPTLRTWALGVNLGF
jgi:TonB-linked SusC/RagA family outer membrane protein